MRSLPSVLAVLLVALAGCATRIPAPPPPAPFGQDVAVVPDSLDRMLLQMELWRTRLGLSDCLTDTTDDGVEARVSLVTLDLFVSPYGSVDSVSARSSRATPQMITCVRDVVRTWYLSEDPAPRRYRFTLPMSARLAEAELGGPVDAADPDGRRVMRSVMMLLWSSRQTLAECYLMARPVPFPVGELSYSGGLVVVRFSIHPDGMTSGVRIVESTLNEPELDTCLIRTIAGWRMPRGQDGLFEFPINFAPLRSAGSPAEADAKASGS